MGKEENSDEIEQVPIPQEVPVVDVPIVEPDPREYEGLPEDDDFYYEPCCSEDYDSCC